LISISTITPILSAVPDNFSTTLSTDISVSAISVNLDSITGLGTEGVGVIFKKKIDGTPDATTIEFVHWTGLGTNIIILTDTGDRGIAGSYAGAQAHAKGDTFEVWVHSSYYPRTAILAEHSSTGVHDTTKVVDLVTAQTLTNKTLTSPILQGIVDGWISANETWAYASATTITVPTGATAKYAKGDKLKLTQTTVKYFYVIGVTDTVLTVVGNGAVVVTNAAISANYYSHIENPNGFPAYFTWTPTWTSEGGAFTNNPTLAFARFYITGGYCHVAVNATYDATSGGSGRTQLSFPVVPSDTSVVINGVRSSGNFTLAGWAYTDGNGYFYKYDGTTAIANSVAFSITCDYAY